MAVFSEPVELFNRVSIPIDVLFVPEELENKDDDPTAVLLFPVELNNESQPIAVL
jgi:hypothetical protein